MLMLRAQHQAGPGSWQAGRGLCSVWVWVWGLGDGAWRTRLLVMFFFELS